MIWLDKPFDFDAGAILNFYKPVGPSSFWMVKQIKRLIQTKVGHAGTLDPFAEGVLLLCTGRATKQVERLMALPKEYIGEIELGVTTDTDDRTGSIIDQRPVPTITASEFEKICQQFVGDSYQVPPMFAAKKWQGRRLYQLARSGQVVQRAAKLIHIDQIILLSFDGNIAKILVRCSKGTYIRALARDIGLALSCGGHLKSLIRTKIGEFNIADAMQLDQFKMMLNSPR